MVKKIKKYLKFAVCCALIISLVAPSYAALSASDGSAFVTKAEFDAALADFNSRLTSFEAGINSKIDSQVSSYLDRNGIWNGKELKLTGLWGAGQSVGLYPILRDNYYRNGNSARNYQSTGVNLPNYNTDTVLTYGNLSGSSNLSLKNIVQVNSGKYSVRVAEVSKSGLLLCNWDYRWITPTADGLPWNVSGCWVYGLTEDTIRTMSNDNLRSRMDTNSNWGQGLTTWTQANNGVYKGFAGGGGWRFTVTVDAGDISVPNRTGPALLSLEHRIIWGLGTFFGGGITYGDKYGAAGVLLNTKTFTNVNLYQFVEKGEYLYVTKQFSPLGGEPFSTDSNWHSDQGGLIGAMNNQGLDPADCTLLCVLNNDTKVY